MNGNLDSQYLVLCMFYGKIFSTVSEILGNDKRLGLKSNFEVI